MEISKMTTKGQLTVPLAVRKSMGLQPGDKAFFFEDNNGYRIVNASGIALNRVQKAFEGEAERLGLPTEDAVVEMIREVRRKKGQCRGPDSIRRHRNVPRSGMGA